MARGEGIMIMMMMIMMKMMLMILAMVIVCGQSGHFCSNDHDLMNYMDEIAQVVSINCSVSANPSNDLVFRFQIYVYHVDPSLLREY